MPNRRKPSKVLELSGSFKTNPKLLRSRMNTPRDIAALNAVPPKHLPKLEQNAWREIVEMAPDGVLTRADSHTVEITAVLFAAFRESGAEMKSAQLSLLVRLLGSIGCVPSERHKVEVCETNPGSNNRFLND